MPGNELGDRVHNFFPQENASQGQHHSQVVEGNWPVISNNFWNGNQRQIDVLTSNNKNRSSPNSDHVTHGLSFAQSNVRPDFPKSQPLNQPLNLNGFMYGNQFQQTRQNEANFLAMDTDPDQRHLITSRGLTVHELQQSAGPDHQAKAPVRSESSISPISFDLFGGQQQMNHQQSGMLQPLQHPQSGLSEMQQLQQQLMIRKMQELQRQQQLRQFDLRQQNLINQVPPFGKQASGSQSMVNGSPNSDLLQYPWTADIGTSWLNRVSPIMQGSVNGHVFSPNMGQTQRLVDGVPQQVDQSLYGVPVSNSGGLPVNHYIHMMTNRSSLPQMQIASNSLQGNQHNLSPDQVGLQNVSSVSRHKFQNENMLGHVSSQAVNTGIRNMESFQQLNSMPGNAPQQDFLGRQNLTVRQESSVEKPDRQAASPQNEVSLDPTEAKILFGSDDNIWSAFGKTPHVSGEAGNSFDQGGLNGLPSMQSGSWSALMQSAVAETSSSDIAPQEEWSGLIFNSSDGPSANQPPSMHNDNVKHGPSLADDNMQIPSTYGSRSMPPDDINAMNAMALNQFGHKFQNEPGQRLQTEMSQQFVQSMGEASKWSNRGALKPSVAEGSQLYRNVSHHPPEAERNTKTISKIWAPGQTETTQSNGWNAMSSGGDRGLDHHEPEKLSQNSQSNQLIGVQGRGNSFWKSNTVPSSASDMDHVEATPGSTRTNKGIMTLNDAASVDVSSNMGMGDETSPFVQNNGLFNQWKNVNAVAKSGGAESLGRMMHQVSEPSHILDSINSRDKEEVARREMENCDMKENSSDSHRSNLSQHASGGFRESGLSDVSDSRSMSTGKQKSSNQLTRKVSVPRKFQYHPMGNLEEDVETNYVRKQPTYVQAMSVQNTQLGQSQFLGQVSRNSTVMEKGQSEVLKENKNTEDSLRGGLPDHVFNKTVPVNRSFDTYTSNKASSSSQNMLELLHKVDQSRDHGAMMQFSPPECKASSQLPEAQNFDGVGRLIRSQSSASQGFGLQLGPPSQRLQIPDQPLSFRNAQGTVISGHVAAETGYKGQQMGPNPSVQSLPFANEESEGELRNNQSASPKTSENEKSLYKIPGNFPSAFSSGIPYSRSHLQDQQITRVSGRMPMNQQIDSSGNTSYLTQRGSLETALPDASASIQHDRPSSSGGTSQQSDPSDIQDRVPTATMSTRDHNRTSQHVSLPGISRHGDSAKMLHNMWMNVPQHLQNSGAQFQKVSSHIPESLQPNILESNSALLTQGYVNLQGAIDGQEKRSKESSGQPVEYVNRDTISKLVESQTSSMKNQLNVSPANSASTQKDIEAFGRSLKPNSFPHQNYALLNQMQASRDAENDLNSRVSKRIKGPDNVLDIHQVALKDVQQNENSAVVGDSRGSSAGPAPEDSRMLSFSRPADILQKNTSQHANMPSQMGLARDVSLSNTSSDYMTSGRVDHPQVSPQMAPSWFTQYGAFRNGQILTMYDGRNATPSRHGEPPFTLGKPSSGLDTLNSDEKSTAVPIDASQIGNSHRNSGPLLVANGQVSAPQSSDAAHHPVILRPKKRKTATSELHPWRKEITDGSQNHWTLRLAESDWGKALNRLTEKVDNDGELIEDGPPLLRSRRRLILTTQLMQQLIRPAPAAILCADASSEYESVAYTICRLALGDACSAVSRPSGLDPPPDGMDINPAKGKVSDKNADRHLAKVIVNLTERARKLESDFLRLDKSASILDLRVECQDVEKFSVINRFARFHGRGQTDSGEATSNDVNASSQKPNPQRYVTALPVPRSLPDRVQCLSL